MVKTGAEERGSMSDLRGEPLKVLVVSGGHPFELEPFLAMFSANPDIDYTHVQPPEAREWVRASHVGEWDAIVCYDMQGFILRNPELLESEEPSAEPVKYAEGLTFEEPPLDYAEGLIGMLEAGQGMVFLHHPPFPRGPRGARGAGAAVGGGAATG